MVNSFYSKLGTDKLQGIYILISKLEAYTQGNFLFLIPARIDFCWPQEIKTQYKTHRIGFLERSLAKTQAWGPRIMSRLAWTTKITALCEVSSCVNSSVFVFLAPARIIFSNRKFPWCGLRAKIPYQGVLPA